MYIISTRLLLSKMIVHPGRLYSFAKCTLYFLSIINAVEPPWFHARVHTGTSRMVSRKKVKILFILLYLKHIPYSLVGFSGYSVWVILFMVMLLSFQEYPFSTNAISMSIQIFYILIIQYFLVKRINSLPYLQIYIFFQWENFSNPLIKNLSFFVHQQLFKITGE